MRIITKIVLIVVVIAVLAIIPCRIVDAAETSWAMYQDYYHVGYISSIELDYYGDGEHQIEIVIQRSELDELDYYKNGETEYNFYFNSSTDIQFNIIPEAFNSYQGKYVYWDKTTYKWDYIDKYPFTWGSGYEMGRLDGYNSGYDIGYTLGEQIGYASARRQYAYEKDGVYYGYYDGYENGQRDILNSLDNSQIIYHDVELPNGVKDEITDTQLIDNVGKVVLNGSEVWSLYSAGSNDNFLTYWYKEVKGIVGSKLVINTLNQLSVNEIGTKKGIYSGDGGGILALFVCLPKEELTTFDKNGFLNWLQDNNLEIYYQLAEPITYDLIPLLVDANGSYADGYDTGLETGKDIGYKDGYNSGYDAGQLSDFDGTSWMKGLFGSNGLGGLLKIEILPGLSIGTIVMIPLMLTLVPFVIGLFKGGKND